MSRGIFLVAALALTACPSGKKCTTNADCTGGQVCSVMSGTCGTSTGMGGGIGGGGLGGGTGGGNGGGSGGGSVGGGNGGGNAGGGSGNTDGGMSGGETCEMAESVTANTFTGSTIGKASDYDIARDSTGTGCNDYSSHPGADVVYKLTVPARSRIEVSLQGMGGDGTSMATPIYDPATYLVALPASNCSLPTSDGGIETRCIASSADPLDALSDLAAPEVVGYTNFTANPVELLFVVESGWEGVNGVDEDGDNVDDAWATDQGDFSVTVTTTALPPAPGNDTCATATALPTTGTPLASQTTAGATPDITFGMPTTCTNTTGLGDVFYTVPVPAGQRLTVSATTAVAMNVIGVNIFEGACTGVATCTTAVSQTSGTAAAARFDNRGTADVTVSVEVATANDASTGATFSISATLAAIPPPPANDTCTGAIALVNATATNGTTVGALSDLTFASSSTGCVDTSGDGDVYYSVMVQPGQRLTVSATTPTDDLAVNIFAGACSMVATCKSGSSFTGGTPATAKYDNTGTTATAVLVQVSTNDSAQLGAAFTITATSGAIPPPPANDACAAAQVLAANTLTNGTTSSAASSMLFGTGASATCSGTSTAKRDVFYQLQIAPGKTATITVTPAAGLDTLINVIEPVTMCSGVTACIAKDDTGFAGQADVATYTNSGTTAKTVLLQIAAWSNNEGDFTINAVIP